MQISEKMIKEQEKLKFISNSQSVRTAWELMESIRTPALPVQKENKIIGIISKRQIKEKTKGDVETMEQLLVSEMMSTTVKFVLTWQDVRDVDEKMEKNNLNEVIVADTNHTFAGLYVRQS